MYLLPNDVVVQIKEFIKQKLNDDTIKSKYPNPLLREDIFSILDIYCTVVYFPLREDSINGFHITGIVDSQGSENTFVYINTAQTIEKQIFTAAHELGHIWGVDIVISKGREDAFLHEFGEKIINRFAAELLMPEALFFAACASVFEHYKEDKETITIPNVIKAITQLMTCFFVPYKAVVYRIFELKIISENSALLLLGDADISKEEIRKLVDRNLRDMGYINFLNPSHKCWIDGLAEILDKAEQKQSVSKTKIDNLRKLFSLSDNSQISEDLDKKLNISLEGD